MLKRIVAVAAIAMAAIVAGVISQSDTVEAWPAECELEGYHYARQWTTGVEPAYYHEEGMGCSNVVAPAFVAHGVGGDLQAPIGYPIDFNPYIDHVLGSYSLTWYSGINPIWIEFGFYTGTIGHGTELIQRLEEELDPGDLTGWGMFVEVVGPGVDDYEIVDLGEVVDPEDSYFVHAWERHTDGSYEIAFTRGMESVSYYVSGFPSVRNGEHGLAIAGLEIFDYDCAASEDCDTVPQTSSFKFSYAYVKNHSGWNEPMEQWMTHSQVSHYDEVYGDGSPAEPLIAQHFDDPEESMAEFVAHSHLACPVQEWPVANDDVDCDGYTDIEEHNIPTDVYDACPDNIYDHAWPPDNGNDRMVSLADVLAYIPHMNASCGNPAYDWRLDLNNDCIVALGDVLQLTRFMNMRCSG